MLDIVGDKSSLLLPILLVDLNVVISMPESVDICPEKSSVFLLDTVSWFEVSVFPRSLFIGSVETWVEYTCKK